MKLKNYLWNGFGFPVIFAELPAVKLRGELIPDVNWTRIGEALIKFICILQEFPLSGNQVKFIRNSFGMSLREFSKFIGVKHQSLMRWEKRKNHPAGIEAHIEIVLRLKVLRKVGIENSQINEAIDHVEDVEKFKSATYKSFKPIRVPGAVASGHF